MVSVAPLCQHPTSVTWRLPILRLGVATERAGHDEDDRNVPPFSGTERGVLYVLEVLYSVISIFLTIGFLQECLVQNRQNRQNPLFGQERADF
jgi:hypothetical protein